MTPGHLVSYLNLCLGECRFGCGILYREWTWWKGEERG